jgi:hypothetical protein
MVLCINASGWSSGAGVYVYVPIGSFAEPMIHSLYIPICNALQMQREVAPPVPLQEELLWWTLPGSACFVRTQAKMLGCQG